ncbi:MAG: ATP-binding protein [Oscillospiraceae bacterium]|nr:ATP-binding protein [Oscillospiraceae bacterium]
MIKQPNELTFNDKKFSMILYGAPGVGKTTLALSAPNPILIDFDRGVSRVKAYHRTLTIVCSTYEEVLSDIEAPEIKDCETIVIDTGGSFVSFLQAWAMRINPAVNRQKDGKTISQKGFGAVKQEFQRFTNYVRDTLDKNVIYVFHSDEQKDKDGNPQYRILCEGAAKNIVWQPCDFGGYVQMVGNNRVVTFSPTQEFFAKGCYGIEGQMVVSTIGPTDKNNFITNLFAMARENIAKDAEAFVPLKEQYDKTMAEATATIDAIETAEDATHAIFVLSQLEHALTSKREASAMLKAKADELGFVLDKEKMMYREAE